MSDRPLVLAALVTCLLVAGCAGTGEEPDIPSVTQQPEPSTPGTTSPTPSPTRTPSREEPARPRVVGTVAEGLEVPWGIDFLPDGTAVVTERDSRRVLTVGTDGTVSTVGVVEQASPTGEGGLLGVAVSPDFDRDRTVYLYATTDEDNRVLRARLSGGRLEQPEVVLTGIPAGVIHDGGRLRFSPEGHLFVTTGETGEPGLAQDPASLAGKILRITTEGEPAPGNPDPDSPVWTSGHRNVQGLAVDADGTMWASEFGDDDFDELNLLRPGSNYGWPEVEGTGGEPRFTDPRVTWRTAEASPSGLAFAEGHLWMAALRGEQLWRIDVAGRRAGSSQGFLTGYGRLRTVVLAPSGDLWVATSNRDGRGAPRPGDDRILRVRLD